MRHIVLAPLILALTVLHGCYNYYPVGTQTRPISPEPQKTVPKSPTEVGPPKPKPQNSKVDTQPSASTPQSTATGKSSQAEISPETRQQIATQQTQCQSKIPDVQGRRGELVQCMVESTDAILDRADPLSANERHAMGQFAMQLARQEDQGEITREEAEASYQQFVEQHSPKPPNP